jgi:hypothetical protein
MSPPLWSSGQSFWLQIQRSWVLFPALPVFLRSYLEKIVAAPVKKTETNYRVVRCADHATPSIRKSWHYFANKLRSLGRYSLLANQSHGVIFAFCFLVSNDASAKHTSENDDAMFWYYWWYEGAVTFNGVVFLLRFMRISFLVPKQLVNRNIYLICH